MNTKYNYQDILTKFSKIKEVAEKLEGGKYYEAPESEPLNATADLSEAAARRKPNQYSRQYGLVSHYYKEGQWHATLCKPQAEKKKFLRDVKEVIESSDEPDGVRIQLISGRTRDAKKKFERDIYFDENNKPATVENNLKQMQEQVSSNIKQALEDFKANHGEGKSSDIFELRMELLQKDFDGKLKEQQHQQEVKQLNKTIAELNEIIHELEDDLDNAGGALNGLQEDFQKREQSISEMIFSRVLASAGENILRGNPKLLKIGFGLSDEEIAKVWNAEEQPKLNGKPGDNSSWTENSENNPLKGLSEEQATAIGQLEKIFALLPPAHFEKVHNIVILLLNPQTGAFREEDANTVLELLKEKK